MKSVKIGRATNAPYFRPWIGADVRKHLASSDDPAFGTVFHVLGESHYSRPGPDAYESSPDLTIEVVRDWALSPSRGSAFFTRVAAVVANQPPGSFDRKAVWEGFAYSNYVQELLPGPRIPPSADQLQEAAAAFFGQLALTRPEVLVVLGNAAWRSLPANVGFELSPVRVDIGPDWPTLNDAWFYPHRIGDCLLGTIAVKVVHPSSGGGHWNWEVAAKRAHTARLVHSNVLEWVKDNYSLLDD